MLAIIKIKLEGGKGCRITALKWAAIPAPAILTDEHLNVSEIIQPDEIFIAHGDFLQERHKTPEQEGFTCEWQVKNGKRVWGCWVAQEVPLRRRTKGVEQIRLAEEIDNAEEALSSDQLAKRFKAESAALAQGVGSLGGVAQDNSVRSAPPPAARPVQPVLAPETTSSGDAPRVGQSLLADAPAAATTPATPKRRGGGGGQVKAAKVSLTEEGPRQ